MNANLHFLQFLCLFAFFSYSIQGDDVCANIDCGQGSCKPDIIGWHCECDPGWQTIKVGPMPFGSCIIPNCTMDFSCGGKYSAAPPVPFPPPPINFTSPCNFVWCGDGDCVVNNTGHYCQCHERAANLFDNPEFICIQQCYMDGDCNDVGFGAPPPPPSSTASPGAPGKNDASYSFKRLPITLLAIFVTIFLSKT